LVGHLALGLLWGETLECIVISDIDGTELGRIDAVVGMWTHEGEVVSSTSKSCVIRALDIGEGSLLDRKYDKTVKIYYSEAVSFGFVSFEIDHQEALELAVEREFRRGESFALLTGTVSQDVTSFILDRSHKSKAFEIGYAFGLGSHKKREALLDILYMRLIIDRFHLEEPQGE
jgi:hypothetical protein